VKAVRTLLTGVLASMLAVLVVLSPANAAAQALYGTLTGTVVDDSGAAIPGATVTVGSGFTVTVALPETVPAPQPPASDTLVKV